MASLPASVEAQQLTREADMSVGTSSENVQAGGVQGRLFGSIRESWRVYLEASWAGVSRAGSDAFGAAFPYDRRIRLTEAYVEHVGGADRRMIGFKAGRYRTPFGIHHRSDHAYTGFTRAPLIRYGSNWALSNTALETGVAVFAGAPALSAEASVGVPTDGGDYPRARGVDAVVRVQTFRGPVIVGASYLSSRPFLEGPWVTGRTSFGGIDARFMRGGVQLRGEWILGRSFDTVRTSGGYIDVLVHRERMGPVTLVGRAERLDYDAAEHSAYLRRYTLGARIVVGRDLSFQVNLLGQPDGFMNGRRLAADVGVTHTVRF